MLRKLLMSSMVRGAHVQLQNLSDCPVSWIIYQYAPVANPDRCYGALFGQYPTASAKESMQSRGAAAGGQCRVTPVRRSGAAAVKAAQP